MMIQYDKTELENIFLVEEAYSLKNAGFITKEQYSLILKDLSILKNHKNILIRIGFFLLGSFLYSSICGFLTGITISAFGDNYRILLYIYALIGFAGAELLTRQNYFGYGLDDAFLIGSQLTLAIAIGFSTNGNGFVIASILSVTLLVSYLRYLHLSILLLFCVAITGSVTFALFELGTHGKTLLPFTLMAFALGLYLSSKRIIEQLKEPFYYKGLMLVNSFSLVLFYLSGNYMVVRELSEVLLSTLIGPKNDIPFAFIFYALTFIVPISYIVYSLLQKDRILLWIGLLGLGFSIYSIRFYYAILPIESALTLGGGVLFAFTYFSIKKIKGKETGITFQPDRFTKGNALATDEILIASQLGLKPENNIESPIEFGGGDFSGGGSSGNF